MLNINCNFNRKMFHPSVDDDYLMVTVNKQTAKHCVCFVDWKFNTTHLQEKDVTFTITKVILNLNKDFVSRCQSFERSIFHGGLKR